MRLVFAGTPEVAVPALDALLASSHEVVAVLTRPDARSGRGRREAASPVALRAAEARCRDAEAGPRLRPRAARPAAASSRRTAARWWRTARWCPPALLDLPPHGWVNLHFSLLPAWRGAAPVQHAILHGDDVTGASVFTLEEGLDTGPVLSVMTEPIRPAGHQRRPARPARDRGRRPAGGHPRRARARRAGGGAAAGRRRQPRAEADRRGRPGRLVGAGLPRRPAGPGLHARAGRLDHLGRRPARSRPGRAGCAGRRPAPRDLAPGQVSAGKRAVLVGTGDGQAVRLGEVRPAGRKPMAAADWARGVRDLDGGTLPVTGAAAEGQQRRPPRQGKPRPDAAAAGRVRPAARGGRARRLRQPDAAGAAARARPATRATRRSPPSSAYGTLRGRGTYDAVLAACVDRPLDQVDPPVLDLLRLGAHQLLAMRVPSHAAVGATVELARAVVGEGRGSFVNAVLRKVGGQDLDAWLTAVAPAYDDDPVGHLAVVHSHPRWVVSALRDALGGSLERTAALLAADNVPPQVTLVARPGRATVAELVEAGAEPGRWSPYAAVLPGGDPGALAGRAGGPGRCAGRGQPAGRAGAGRGAARRAGPALARPVRRARAARRRCSGRWPRERGGRAARRRGRAAPGRAGAPGRGGHRRRSSWPTGGCRPGGRRASTGCWSTRRAPGSARCGGGRRRAGAGSRRTSPA